MTPTGPSASPSPGTATSIRDRPALRDQRVGRPPAGQAVVADVPPEHAAHRLDQPGRSRSPQPAHRRAWPPTPDGRRLLAGRLRRRHLHLRRRRLLRLDRRHRTSTSPSSAWPPPPTAGATGWSPPTAASSPSATPPSTARPAPSASTSRSSAWPPPPTARGYWLVASDGGIFTFGDAAFYGSTGSIHLNQPIVGMAATPDGHGYWLVASDGGIFAFGDAALLRLDRQHRTSTSRSSAWPPTPDGQGYWLVASDGGIFAFGDARFYGSTGNIHLNQPDRRHGRAPPAATGYWLVAADGGMLLLRERRVLRLDAGGLPDPGQRRRGLRSPPVGPQVRRTGSGRSPTGTGPCSHLSLPLCRVVPWPTRRGSPTSPWSTCPRCTRRRCA